jgi:lysophospholipase L1-like esterase
MAISDTGSYFTSEDVNGALQQLGSNVADHATHLTSVDSQLASKVNQVAFNMATGNLDFYTGDTVAYSIALAQAISNQDIRDYIDTLVSAGTIAGVTLQDGTVTPKKASFFDINMVLGTNKFNKLSTLNVTDKYLAFSGGNAIQVSFSGGLIMHPIKCGANDVIRMIDDVATKTNPGLIYNSSNVVIGELITYISRANGIRSFLLPNDTNIAYIIANTLTSLIDTQMVTINSGLTTSTPYIPYSETEVDTLKKTIVIPKECVNVKISENPLPSKTIKPFGDSVVRGYGNNNIGFIDMIATNQGMTCTNYAVSGAKLVDDATLLNGATSILTTVLNTDLSADYIIFDGGFNDTSHGRQGAVTTFFTEDATNKWDTTTACGALEKIIYNLYINYPTAKKGYVFPHGLTTLDFNWNTRFRQALKDVLKKWGMPYLDLQELTAPLGNIASLKVAYTYNGDGIHPTGDGYQKYYVDKVTVWLKSL